MHSHFASATHGAAVFLSVLLFGTFWRLSSLHLMRSKRSRFLRGIGRGMMFQY